MRKGATLKSGLIQRLVVRLRSAFPEATVECLGTERLKIVLGPQAPRMIEVSSVPVQVNGADFQIVDARMSLRFECLESVTEIDFNRLVNAENFGLRGVTVLRSENDHSVEGRSIVVRSSFLGLKGRTQDEAENALIDILSMVRFSRLLEDRILRSSAAGAFCFEMYQSQYLSKSGLRNRYINYARSVFQGSAERIFGEVSKTLTDDHGCKLETKRFAEALATKAGMQFDLRIPEETPMLILASELKTPTKDFRKLVMIANRLNEQFTMGHFEVSTDPRAGEPTLSFVQWKHLTNDLRLYAIDYAMQNLAEAAAAVAALVQEPTARVAAREPVVVSRRAAA
jgi:hypothetical protein